MSSSNQSSVIVIGDSQIKYLRRYLPENYDVRSFSGKRLTFLDFFPWNDIPRHGNIVLHLGTNDNSFGVQHSTFENCLFKILKKIRGLNPTCNIFVSEIIPRSEDVRPDFERLNERALIFNAYIRSTVIKFFGAYHVSHWEAFSDSRFLAPDGLHLSHLGVELLANNIKEMIRTITKDRCFKYTSWNSKITIQNSNFSKQEMESNKFSVRPNDVITDCKTNIRPKTAYLRNGDKRFSYRPIPVVGGGTEKTMGNAGRSGEKYTCPTCSKIYSCRQSLHRHKKICTSEQKKEEPLKNDSGNNAKAKEGNKKIIISPSAGLKTTSCPTCSKTYSCRQSLHRHMKICTLEQKKEEPLKNYSGNNAKAEEGNKKIIISPSEGLKTNSCPTCSKTFKWRQSLSRHKKKCESKSEKTEIVQSEYPTRQNQCGPLYTCPHCIGCFINVKSARRHILACKYKTTRKAFRVECLELNCTYRFASYSIMLKHMQQYHFKHFIKKHFMFTSLEKFETWKDDVQVEEYMLPINKSGPKKGTKRTYTYWVCQKDITRTYNMPRLYCKWKRGFVTHVPCPARMLVHLENTGEVNVWYIDEHTHDLNFAETRWHQLPPLARSKLKWMVAMDVPTKKIEDYFQKLYQTPGEGQKEVKAEVPKKVKHKVPKFINGNNIRNYRARYKKLKCFHENDAISVDIWVKNNLSKVFLYKKVGNETFDIGKWDFGNFGGSKENLFIIGLQSNRMCERMREGVHRALCVDATHGTNYYDYSLVNFIVPDCSGKLYPVAHFITNRTDEHALTQMFQNLKSNAKNVDVYCVVTDDDPALFNALTTVFKSSNFRHILCQWHVRRAWKGKVNLIRDEDMREQVMVYLDKLLYTRDLSEFSSTERDFLKILDNVDKPGSKTFSSYYNSYYSKRKEKWASAYRKFEHFDVDTNMYVESYHKTLKQKYLEGKRNRRLDILLMALVDYENTLDTRITKEQLYGIAPSHKNSKSNLAHVRGMAIPRSEVITLTAEKLWKVKSQTKKKEKEFYEVRLINNYKCVIADHCINQCPAKECEQLCMHLYYCTCPVQSNMCKHVHRVHSLRPKTISTKIGSTSRSLTTPTLNKSSENVNLGNEPVCSKNYSKSSPNPPSQQTLNSISTEVSKLNEQIDDEFFTDDDPLYMEILKNLRHANTLYKSIKSSKNPLRELKFNPIKIPSRSKPEKQVRFKKVVKKKKSKKYSLDFNARENILSSKSFTKTLYSKEKDFSQVVLNFVDSQRGHRDEIAITITHLKSLDPYIPYDQVKKCKLSSVEFRKGWLYDCIIDAFLYLSSHRHNTLYYVQIWITQLILRYKFSPKEVDLTRFDFLKSNENIVQNIFVPCNPSGTHWVLLVVTTKNILILDPMLEDSNENEGLKKYAEVWQDFLQKKTKKFYPIQSPSHTCQNDTMSCGVLVCWYVDKIIKNESITGAIDSDAFRKEIFETLMVTNDITEEES